VEVKLCADADDVGRHAGDDAAGRIRHAIARRGAASVIFATGVSQFEVLARLIVAPGIEWAKVTGFHLDEYIGLPRSHPASFRRYLAERLVDRVPLGSFHYVNGEAEPGAECRRLGDLIGRQPIDVALVGIGENGHLAFNDPPADFQTEEPYLVVDLDEACRRQQADEGWFARREDVPRRAITMSIRQIMKSSAIICSAPERRKAQAVRSTLEGPVTPLVPASILQRHPRATIYLDPQSASLLGQRTS
jgi:glucosamine-6-phosphate deaminase